ncbi:DNA-directed DNA polymerase II small subunit [Candidatus Bathyarchaeota archaeon]|nr:MAG: DNA-directed DNA polymerase II small subunit [Candidatus Bathyarchaeota archaeon]
MNEMDKLQKAVELTVAAGYQLDKEAFEFLSSVAEDPTEVIRKLLKKIEEGKEKPLFIGRQLLEETLGKTERELAEPFVEEGVSPTQVQIQPKIIITEGKKPYHPYAKDVESDIRVIEDPASKLNANGTVEGYLKYFRDRYKRLEKLLRQRIDVKGAVSILDALKAPANTKMKVIGMITDKRESKRRIFLTIEDLNSFATVLIPQNASKETLEKARCLMLDQVICFSVRKTRGNLLIAEDILLPEVAKKRQHKASIPVYAVLTSDMHVGSTKFQRDAFNRFILWLNGKYGNSVAKEIASHVKYVLIAGDIVDGIGVYPNQLKELAVKDVYEQYNLAAQLIEQIPDYIEVIIIPGNHDAVRKALPQPAISNSFLKSLQATRKVYSFGNPTLLSLHNVEVLMFHGRSLDDIVSSVPKMDYRHPEKAMTLLLKSRHLAPTYGGKTLISPENKDFLVINHVPDIFHSGHIHVLGYTNYKGVLIVNSGAWQEQTDYMKRMGFTPTPGKVPVVDLQTLRVMVLPFA